LKIQPNFTSIPYDKKHAQVVTPIANQPKPQDDPNKNIKTIGLFAGGIVATLGSIKGINKLINRPPKQLVDLIEGKLASINIVKDKTKESFATHFKNAATELAAVFSRPIESTKEVSDLAIGIPSAKSSSELLKLEESCFDVLSAWFNRNLNSGIKSPEELSTKCKTIAEKLKKQLQLVEQDALEQIKTHSEIPKEFQGKIRTKKALESFDFEVSEAKTLVSEGKDTTIDNFTQEGQSLFKEYNNSSGKIVGAKNNESNNILSLTLQKIENFIHPSLSVLKRTDTAVDMDIIPASMPQSILNNKFYQTLSGLGEKDFEASIPDFVKNMDEGSSLKDLQMLTNRLEIRRKTDAVKTNAFDWYNAKIKQLKDCETKISAYLENSFYGSGKDIDVNNLTLKQEDLIIFALQQHSKKMGFASVPEMISYFTMDSVSKDGQMSKECANRVEKFAQSPISKIYPKIKDKFNDFNKLISQQKD